MMVDAAFCRNCGCLRSNACLTCYNILAGDALFYRKCGTRRMSKCLVGAFTRSLTDSEKHSALEQFSRLKGGQSGALSIGTCLKLVTDYVPGAGPTYERIREAVRRWNLDHSSPSAGNLNDPNHVALEETSFMTITAIILDDEAQRHMGHPIYQIRTAFMKEAKANDDQLKRREQVDHEIKKLSQQTPKGLSERVLDVVPGVMIILNGFVLGCSMDVFPDHQIWGYVEIFFTLFFAAELVLRLYIYGIRRDNLFWLLFDALVVGTATADILLTHLGSFLQ